MKTDLSPIVAVVNMAQTTLRDDLRTIVSGPGFTELVYHRYLSFQYHLTKGVQRAMLKCAAHPDLTGKRSLRDFLFRFALEEEPHYKVAEFDLRNMGLTPLPMLLDVALWWSYFDRVVEERPFIRLGAVCVLENLGAGVGPLVHALFNDTDFLRKNNTRFLELHLHEILPHGDQIIGSLSAVPLDRKNLDHLVEGANTGSILYLRMARWAFGLDQLTSRFNAASSLVRNENGTYEDLEALASD